MCADYVDIKKWRGWLYFINTLMILMGAVLLTVCCWALSATSAAIFRVQYGVLISLGFVVGATVILISFCGCFGGFLAKRNTQNNSRHKCLSVYFVIVSLLVCIQIGVLAGSIVMHIDTQNEVAMPYDPYDRYSMDAEITGKLLARHPQEWIAIQNTFDCCGWAVAPGTIVLSDSPAQTDDLIRQGSKLETGAACKVPEPIPCRGFILTWIMDDLLWVTICSIFILIVEIMALVSTVCLCVCARNKDYHERGMGEYLEDHEAFSNGFDDPYSEY